MAIKIVALSDTHGKHGGMDVPEGDVLVYAGDMTSRGNISELRDFNDFLGTLPHPHKIVIAGNHDFCFERERERSAAVMTNCTYIQDEMVQVLGLNIYGSPWQPWFYDWAFNLQRGAEIKAKWDLIPQNTDILVTHGPPLGFGDTVLRGEKVGCQDLLNTIKIIKPRLHIFGHIHEGYGIYSENETTYLNASICNFSYEPVNDPLVFMV